MRNFVSWSQFRNVEDILDFQKMYRLFAKIKADKLDEDGR